MARLTPPIRVPETLFPTFVLQCFLLLVLVVGCLDVPDLLGQGFVGLGPSACGLSAGLSPQLESVRVFRRVAQPLDVQGVVRLCARAPPDPILEAGAVVHVASRVADGLLERRHVEAFGRRIEGCVASGVQGEATEILGLEVFDEELAILDRALLVVHEVARMRAGNAQVRPVHLGLGFGGVVVDHLRCAGSAVGNAREVELEANAVAGLEGLALVREDRMFLDRGGADSPLFLPAAELLVHVGELVRVGEGGAVGGQALDAVSQLGIERVVRPRSLTARVG